MIRKTINLSHLIGSNSHKPYIAASTRIATAIATKNQFAPARGIHLSASPFTYTTRKHDVMDAHSVPAISAGQPY